MAAKKTKKKLFTVIFVLLSIFIASCSIAYFTDDVYRSESQFKEYVYTYFTEADSHRVQAITAEEDHIVYDRHLSVAMRYPKTGMQGPDEYIKNIVKTAEEDFYATYADTEHKEKIVRFMKYDAYQTQEDAVCIVLTQEDRFVDGDESYSENKKVYTYGYSTETGTALNGINFFNGGYRAQFSQQVLKYLQENYEDELKEGYEAYVTPSVNNFQLFAVTDAGVKFFFQPGTVMDEREGVVSVEIPYRDIEGVVRQNIDPDAIDPEIPMVALTYDDGPYPLTSNRILDCLEKYGQVATFFELGKNVTAYPEVVARKKELGMQIGSHTWSHPNLKTLKTEEIAAQINSTNQALIDACGQPSEVFRPPYGNSTQEVEQLAGVPVILWSVDTLDWQSRDANSVFNAVKAIHDKGGLNGRVILMHSIYESTAQATEMLVPWLLENDYQLVTVTEMIQYGYGETPQASKLYGYGYFYK